MKNERDYINKFSMNRRESSDIKNVFKKEKHINYYDCIQMLRYKFISLKATYEPKKEENRNLYLERDIDNLEKEIYLMEVKYNEKIGKKMRQKKLDLFKNLDDKLFGRTLNVLRND
ncbi:hypothetical protein [Spiroplasma endosymbiont of Labia minor]|uniref:hypothetical protein n=1 Tax=Spiroplasma endosymbiont of Labia minor TaxID=3066305 RepID=UPI0030D13D89